jgi:zinc transport system substrate-binding protein
MKKILVIILFSLPYFIFGAANPETTIDSSQIRVFVTIQPQVYFLTQIGGDKIALEALVEPGKDPHTFDPSPRQVERLSKADVFFTIGMPFEETLVPKITQNNKKLLVVDTTEGLEFIYGVPHYHYKEDGTPVLHGADDPDPHVWLGPNQVRTQIKIVTETLIEIDPLNKDYYLNNYNKFDNQIAEMDKSFKEKLAPLNGKNILAFHPAFAYFTNTYGITQLTIELDGKEPSPKHLEGMIDRALRDGTKIIFTQPEFPVRSADVIARAIGGGVVTLNPLDPNWLELMYKITDSMEKGTF